MFTVVVDKYVNAARMAKKTKYQIKFVAAFKRKTKKKKKYTVKQWTQQNFMKYLS